MNLQRYEQIDNIFQSAVELASDQRADFLDRACAGDAEMRTEVEALLAYDERAQSFIESPVFEEAPELLADDSTRILVGEVIGPFRIMAHLGAGGMGDVYLAEDTRLGRKVALKLLSRSLLGDDQSRTRFLREARLASALDHPNICTIYEIGEAAGHLFIAMQYIEGKTLAQVIGGQPLSLNNLLSISLQVGDGLAAAHAQGIIHRDIKSSNIIITPRGQAKVLDFGLARLLEKEDGETELTRAGAVMGTPAYMSPEQARGERVDHRSDIFSFGLVLYEMATGILPFKGRSVTEIMNAAINEPHTPVLELNNEVPAGLSAIVDRALAKEPADRYQSIEDMTDEIRKVVAQSSILRQLFNSSDIPDGVRVPYVPALRRGWQNRVQQAIQSSRSRAIAAFVAVVALVIMGYFFWPSGKQRQTASLPEIRSIAVLPFKPLLAESRDESLEMGMADTLIARLSNIKESNVRPISAVRKYAGLEQDAVTAGREQKVDAVLDGQIQKSGEKIRVTVRLVRVEDGALLWASQFDEKMTDIFAVQDSISERVAGALALKLSPVEKERLARHHTGNTEAYQLYLKGRYFWNKRTGEAIRRGIDFFEQAIEKDRNYDLAYAGLAESYVLLSNYSDSPPQEAYSKARAAAMEAIKINDNLADAHAALAYIKAGYDWDFAGAEREYKRALELNPNDATAQQWYAEFLGLMGRSTESIAEMKRALELEPLSLIINLELGDMLFFARQDDQAIEQYRKTLDLDPGFVRAHISLGQANNRKGRHEEAISEFQKAIGLDKEDTYAVSQLGYTYALLGRTGEAYRTIEELKERGKRRHVLPYDTAVIYAGLGKKDRAFEWLEKAFAERDESLLYLKVDPALDSLRSDPRLRDLLRRVGFPQ